KRARPEVSRARRDDSEPRGGARYREGRGRRRGRRNATRPSGATRARAGVHRRYVQGRGGMGTASRGPRTPGGTARRIQEGLAVRRERDGARRKSGAPPGAVGGRVIIAIPSKGRPANVKSTKVLPSAVLYVPEFEVPDYTKANPASTVVGVPSDVRGITKTRNWILKNAGDRWVVMVDDDVLMQGWTKLHAHRGEQRKLDEAQWLGEMVKLFEITEQ